MAYGEPDGNSYCVGIRARARACAPLTINRNRNLSPLPLRQHKLWEIKFIVCSGVGRSPADRELYSSLLLCAILIVGKML